MEPVTQPTPAPQSYQAPTPATPQPAPVNVEQIRAEAVRDAKRELLGQIDATLGALGLTKPEGAKTIEFLSTSIKGLSELSAKATTLQTEMTEREQKLLNASLSKALNKFDFDPVHDGLKSDIIKTAAAKLRAEKKIILSDDFEVAIEGGDFSEISKSILAPYLKKEQPDGTKQTPGATPPVGENPHQSGSKAWIDFERAKKAKK